jgi:hypothetical protein
MGMITRLNEHTIIGVDVSETLIDHDKSDLLQDFIAREHGRKSFIIITHLMDAWKGSIFEDLIAGSFGVLSEHMFKEVHTMPESIYQAYARDQTRRRRGVLTLTESTAAEIGYLHWKSQVAKRCGCTVLVDDRPDLNKAGCDTLGIEFIDTALL